MHVKGICHDTSFYILEGVCLLCVLMAVCRLWIISRFNVLKSPQHQLHNLINYKRCYAYETVLGIPLAGSGIFLSIFFGECRLANWLFLHRPRYSYGNKLRMDGMDKTQDNDAED